MNYFFLLNYSEQQYILNKFKKKLKDLNSNEQELINNIAYQYIFKHKPIFKQFNEKFLYENSFYTDDNTLDPRYETEILIDNIISYIKNEYKNKKIFTILELGVGTGCICISILSYFEKQNYLDLEIKILGIDICEKALNVAKLNAKNILSNIENITFIQNDWLNNIEIEYDILISNPPYLNEFEIKNNSNLKYDPYIALYGGINRLDKIIEIWKKKHLFNHIFLEIHPLTQIELSKLFINSKFINDLNNLPRVMYWSSND